jgi:hypothetical protein
LGYTTLTPAKDLSARLGTKTLEAGAFQDSLLELLQWVWPDWNTAFQSTTGVASSVSEIDVAPPDVDSEWEIGLLKLSMTTIFDNADIFQIYLKLSGNLRIPLMQVQAGQMNWFASGQQIVWPLEVTSSAQPNSQFFAADPTLLKPLILKNKGNGDPFNRIEATLSATATAGTRAWLIQYAYRQRQKLNP